MLIKIYKTGNFVNKASRKSEQPTFSDNQVVNILKYLNNTKDYKIKYDGKRMLIAYTDSNFAGDKTDLLHVELF